MTKRTKATKAKVKLQEQQQSQPVRSYNIEILGLGFRPGPEAWPKPHEILEKEDFSQSWMFAFCLSLQSVTLISEKMHQIPNALLTCCMRNVFPNASCR